MKTIERTFWEKLKRFLFPFNRNKLVTLRATFYYGMWAITPIIHVFFAQKLVELIENKNVDEFIDTVVYYAIYIILFEIISYRVRKWGWVETVHAYRRSIQMKYINKYISLNNTETEKIGTGKLISIIGTGMDTWSVMLNNIYENILKIVFTLIFTLYMIMVINFSYGILFLFLYIIIHIIGEYFNKKTLVYRRKRQDEWNTYSGHIVKVLMSKFEILQTSSIEKEIKVINKSNDYMKKYTLLMADPNHWFYHIPKIFITTIKFFVLSFIGYNVIIGNYSLSIFVGLFGVLLLMDSVIANSMTYYSHFAIDFTKVEKMWDFFDSTPEITGYENGNTFKHKTGKISVKKLNYGYSPDKPIFKDFNLDISGEKVTAIVGLSGSGKSTLVKLISGYIKPDSGDIIIDDQKLSETSLKSYYKDIGYLTQEPSVFDGSVLENLTYAVEKPPIPNPFPPREKGDKTKDKSNILSPSGGKMPKADRGLTEDDKIDKILSLAKCEFIYNLPNGINTEIGEKGIRLSGGQRQRLAIAKIFLKDPKIIILDEPTSALDSFSEEQITKAMNNLFKGRTVIVIAHRLQTVKHADDIIVLEGGEIVERGNHSELVDRDGIYNKMLELQSGF